MSLPPLGYSTNLHPAETVAELLATLERFAAVLRQRLDWPRLGLDLRLGSRAIAELADGGRLRELRAALDGWGLSAHTINAFPLSPFQTAVVKDVAYRPDWTTPERLRDTLALIPIALALSDDPSPTISTVPGSYKPWGVAHNDWAVLANALGQWAAAAWQAARQTGRSVQLALEPEPWCTLEHSREVAAFWTSALPQHAVPACAAALGAAAASAPAAVRDHLGICLDTCHVSVAFEDQATAVERMHGAGARIVKCQLSAAPQLREPATNVAGLAALRALAEPRFLHQTAAQTAGGSMARVNDLDQLDALLARLPAAATVRSHFHIPVDQAPAGGLESTISDSLLGLRAALAAGCRHVAVETYTWSVLAQREADALGGTERELRWLAGQVHG